MENVFWESKSVANFVSGAFLLESRNYVQMEEKKENKLLDDIRGHITVVDELPFRIADDDPFLVRKLEEAHKTLEETPIPDFILKRMTEKD